LKSSPRSRRKNRPTTFRKTSVAHSRAAPARSHLRSAAEWSALPETRRVGRAERM